MSPTFTTLYGMPIASRFLFLNFNAAAYGRLIRREFASYELPSLIDAVLSIKDGDAIRCLSGDNAQTFIDVIDEARSTLTRHRESFN